jgi:CRISPR-associated protein Csx10
MKQLAYRIHLLEPALVTSLMGDPNSAVAYDFLPGSVLRGAILSNYCRMNDFAWEQIDAADPDLRRLFFDGTTRYLNGYLLCGEGAKQTVAEPVPLSWHREKGEEKPFIDFAVWEPDEDDERQWQPDMGFRTLDGSLVSLARPERTLSVHIARNRRIGTAREGLGAIYRYDALAAGQSFEAKIICEAHDVSLLQNLLAGRVHLGGSRSAGYGLAEIEFRSTGDVEEADENGPPTDVEGDPDLEEERSILVIHLLSDLLLRDRSGQYTLDPEVLKAALESRLGVALTLRRSFFRSREVGGFNRKWGMPLPQAQAFQMGSVFVFEDPDSPGLSDRGGKLRELGRKGLGERRAEGFGTFAVVRETRDTWDEVEHAAPWRRAEEEAPSLADASRRMAKEMAERLLRLRLDRQIVSEVNQLSFIRSPRRSQIARLRAALNRQIMSDSPDPVQVLEFLNMSLRRSVVSRQFERSMIGTTSPSTSLSDWLRKELDMAKKHEGWVFNDRNLKGTKVAGEEGNASQLRVEYNLRFIDAVLARVAKEGQE